MTPAPESPWRTYLLNLKAWGFYCFPHRWVSALAYWLSRIETPAVKNFLIRSFVSFFGLRMEDAEIEDPEEYPTLNALFIRTLKKDVRPWPEDPDALAAPCDSRISQFGQIEEDRIIQAKGQTFTVDELLGGPHPEFAQGRFATLYLSPDDCHRVYMPADGRLIEMCHIPGRQFTVASYAVERIPRLYARNERVANLFEGPDGTPFAVVMVGAVNVACIEMSWCGIVAPRRRAISRWRHNGKPPDIELRRGDELGCFHLGSTVVLLSGHPDRAWHPSIETGQAVAYGQPLLLPKSENGDASEAPPDDGE